MRLAPRLPWAKDPPFVQGNMIRGVFGPTAIQDKLLFRHHVFKLICFKLSKYPLLGDVGFLGGQAPLLRASITCCLFCSLDIMTWPMWTLATVPWGFPKAPHMPVWS